MIQQQTQILQKFSPYLTIDTYANLLTTHPAADNVDAIILVETATGVWGVNRKTSGLYLSDGVNWNKVSSFITAFNDANFTIYDNVDTSKLLGFVLDAISTGVKRFITMPDRDIDLNLVPDSLPKVIEVSATVVTSTTSSTYVVIPSMTFTIVTPGKYYVAFSSTGSPTVNSQIPEYAIHVNASIITRSQRRLDGASASQGNALDYSVHTHAILDLSASDIVDVRFQTDSGVFNIDERNLILIRTGA